jgi:O-antigen/teichoic acid export membrane protein
MLSSLVAARLLGAAMYGELAFFVFITKTILVGNIGAISGFIVHYYTGDIAAQDRAVGSFKRAYTIHLLALASICFAAGIWAGPVYGFAALGFTVLIPFFVLEPQARIQRKFYVSLIPDLVLSAAVIGGTVTYVLLLRSNISPWPLLWVGLLWMVVLSVAVAWAIWPSLRNPELQGQQSDWTSYRRLIAIGIPRFLATCAFTVFLMVDRVFLERFYDRAELGVYMLAFQLATGAGLLLSAQNLVSGIDIGEAIRKSEVLHQLLRRLLTRSLGLGGLGLGSAAMFSYLLEHHFLSGYAGLFHATLLLSVGLVAFLTAGNLTDLAYYRGAHRPLIGGLIALLAASITFNGFNLYQFHGTPVSLASFTGTMLLLYSCYAAWYVHKVAHINSHTEKKEGITG